MRVHARSPGWQLVYVVETRVHVSEVMEQRGRAAGLIWYQMRWEPY